MLNSAVELHHKCKAKNTPGSLGLVRLDLITQFRVPIGGELITRLVREGLLCPVE